MGIKFANNAVSRLAGNISQYATSIVLSPGGGMLFPTLAAGEWFHATIIGTGVEIVKVAARSVDTLTVERGQDGTVARDFLAGDRVELRLTAGVLAEIALPPGIGPLPWSLPFEPAGWIFADGRILLPSSPYIALRAAYILAGFPYGQDGSGNPMVPDMRGRVAAGLDNMGGSAAGRITAAGSGITGTTLGASGGAQTHTLTAAQMPSHNHGVNDYGHIHGAITSNTGSDTVMARDTASGSYALSGGGPSNGWAQGGIDILTSYSGISIQSAGSGGAHNNTQPTLMTNYILKT